jgi:23S rRNA pseudouridine955/2504/2580 synthase
MREFTVTPKYDQKRVDSFLFDMIPSTNASVIFKAFRKRSVKVNEKRVKESYLLNTGDKVQVYIPDDYLEDEKNAGLNLPNIIYEDSFLMVVSKPQGMPVHQDRNEEELVLDRCIQDLVRQRDSISLEAGFPALCHRLDRNTGGLTVMAKDSKTLAIMEEKFQNHEIRKSYLCLVAGIPKKKSAELSAFLWKDRKKSQVYIYDNPVKGSERIITRYRVVKSFDECSLLEIELVTGKTHQIRAHMAHIGHPLLGDGKYGVNHINRVFKLKWQALWAIRLVFDFSSPSDHLDYLKGKTLSLGQITWEDGLKGVLKEYNANSHNIE